MALQGILSKEIISIPKTVKIIPVASSFVATRTPSRRSLGSVGHYSMD
jgi:hypothetical protein